MTILNHPSALELSGNLTRFRISSAEAFTFVLKKGSEVLLSQVYNPGTTGIVEIDIREAVESKLSYLFQDASTIYEQANLVGTFTATIDATVITFTAIRSGVDRFADSATNFLTANFLTWQAQVNHVTYYSPEFLTYYSPAGGVVKLVAHYQDDTTEILTLGSLVAGKAYTIPLQYATINALLTKKLPAYYDVYVTNAGGDRLSYIQRFAASNIKSEDERWFLFENSLGGLDTIRAYGADGFTGEHTHNIADIDEVAEEYRVDTSRIYSKNTGYLDEYERRWLLDFFPSKKKYVYTQSSVRQIVVTESDVDYNSKDLPSSYSFKYRFSEAKPYLNLSRVDEIPDEITLYTPDVGSFTLPLRLNDLPHIELTEGALIPGQNPYSEHAGVFSVAELIAYLKSSEQLDVAFVKRSATGATIEGNGKTFGIDVDADGNLVFHGNIYATGSVAALGVGVGGGGTSYNRLDTWDAYIPGTTDTWVLSALLGHDLHTRVTALESDTPNVAWGVPTTDYVPLTVNAISRQLSIHGHGHTFASLSSKPTTIAGYGITDSLIYEGDARLTNSRPASDVSSWAKAATKPSYSYSDVGAAAASHTHGNITNDGKIGTVANLVVVTGTAGALTAKTEGTTAQYLRGDGSWATPPDTVYVHPTKTARNVGGTAHFITAFTSDTLGHVTDITTAAMTKADVESVLVGNSITSHYHDDRYFQKGELFTKEGSGTEADPYRIRANFPFYGISSVAALGIGSGGGGTAYDRLDTWASYDDTKAGWVLSAALGYDLNSRVSTLEASTPNVSWGVMGSGYIPLTVNGASYQLSTHGHTHTKSSITDFPSSWDWSAIDNKPPTFTPSAHTLGSHSDVTLTPPANGNILKYSGSKWVNNTLAQAGIATPTDISTAISNIEIGGRNLYVNTIGYTPNTPFVHSWTAADSYRLVFDGKIIHCKQPFKAGDIVTIQAESDAMWSQSHGPSVATDGKLGMWVYLCATPNSSTYTKAVFLPNDLGPDKTKFIGTYSLPEVSGLSEFYISMRLNGYSYPSGTAHTANLWNVKLERGNKATDWTPAPEDVDASIATVQTNLTTHAALTNNPHGVTKTQVGLGNVENTALSTWAGSGNITALGTVTTGTWNANTIAVTKGGTGKTSVAANSMLYATAANTYGEVATTAFGRGLLSAVSGTEVVGLRAATATKLATARTIFGQSFDGSGDVTGNATLGTTDATYLQVGAIRLQYDATNNAIKVIKSDGTAANFYATGSNTAFGIGTGGGGSSYNMVSDWSQYVAGSEQWVVSAQLINAIRTSVTGHIGDGTHASAGEKSNWNAAYSHSLVSGGVHMTSTDRNQLTTAFTNNHTHSNKTDLDGISATNITNWGTAYTFANGFATNYPDLVAIEAITGTSGLLKKTAANTWSLDTNTYLTGITKAQVEAVLTGAITSHTHSYLTSVGLSVPIGFSVSGSPITSSGTLGLSYASGYALPYTSTTAPPNPAAGVTLWCDTSVTPNQLKKWNGTSWDIVNEVKVGGRNLFVFNRFAKNISATRGTVSVSDYSITLTATGSDCYTNTYTSSSRVIFSVKPNTKYIFRFKKLASTSGLCYIFGYNNVDDAAYTFSDSFAGNQYIFTTNAIITIISIRFGITNAGDVDTFYDIQLEEGNTATDWTPAPEDTQAQLDAKAAIAQTTYIGTTAIALNRTSAAQSLTGITSIDGSAAKLTTPRALTIGATAKNFDGSAAVSWSLAEIGAASVAGSSTQDFATKNLAVAGTSITTGMSAMGLATPYAYAHVKGGIITENPNYGVGNAGGTTTQNRAGIVISSNHATNNSVFWLSTDATVGNALNIGIGNTFDDTNKRLSLSHDGLLTASNLATANADGAYIQVGPIKILYDATYGAIRVEGNLYATGSNTAFGIGGGAGGGGLITNVYGASGFGGSYSDVDLSSTFNAYAINSLYTALQGKASSDHTHSAASALIAGFVTTGNQSFKGVKGFLDGFDCKSAANFRTSLRVLNNAENDWVTFAERYVGSPESEAVVNLMNIGAIYSAYQDENITSYDEENMKVTHHWDNVYEQNVVVKGYVDAAKVAPGIALARANKFATMGEKLNYQPGMIRSGQIPRKVVVIGNSMTAHAYNATLGWTVSDFREMAASKPDTGWVTLIKKHLVTLNPDVKVYKSNGAAWEVQTLGSKAYSTIQGNAVWEATETGPATTAYTLDSILDSDVDVVIVQLYENVPDTTGNAANCATLSADYQNLYASIRAKCPNARLYQFCGFWQTEGKGTAVMTACARANVEPIHAPVIMWPRTGASQYPDNFKCVAGDIIRDANNNQLCTVSASVAGHPNDFGFGVMAAYTIFKLYNSGGVLNDYLTRFILKVTATNGVADWMDATTDVTADLYYDVSVTTLAAFQAAYAPYLKYMVLGGKYSATVKAPTNSAGTTWTAAHCFLEIKHSGIVGNNYKPTIQRIVSGNDAAKYSVERKVVLSSNAIAYGDFYIVQ